MIYKYRFNRLIIYTSQELSPNIIKELKVYEDEYETILNDCNWIIVMTDKHIMYPNPVNLVNLCISNPCKQLKEILKLFIFPLDDGMLYDERKYVDIRVERVRKLLDEISQERQF